MAYWDQFQPALNTTLPPTNGLAVQPNMGSGPIIQPSGGGIAPLNASTFSAAPGSATMTLAQAMATNPDNATPQATAPPTTAPRQAGATTGGDPGPYTGAANDTAAITQWVVAKANATGQKSIAASPDYWVQQIQAHGGLTDGGGYWSDKIAANNQPDAAGGSSGAAGGGYQGGFQPSQSYTAGPQFSAPQFTPPSGVDMANDPGAIFAMQQADQGINRGLSANGKLLTGAGVKDIAAENIGLSDQDYANVFNRALQANGQQFGQSLSAYQANTGQKNFYDTLSSGLGLNYSQLNANTLLGLSGQGVTAAGDSASSGAGYAGSNAGLVTGQGNATGAGQLAQGVNWASLLSSLDPTSLSALKTKLGVAA